MGTAPYTFGLDELYIRWDGRNAQKFPWLSVVGGRFLNPYGTPTDLIFHKDLTFEGLAATGRLGLGDGSAEQSHLFVTAGAHPLQEVALSGQDKWLVGGQLGANLRLGGGGQRLRITGAFFDYFNVTGRLNPLDSTIYNYTAPQFERQGNTYFDISNSGSNTTNLFALASKYRLVDVNATYELPVGARTLRLAVDAVRNFGYNTAEVSANVGSYVAPRTKVVPIGGQFRQPGGIDPRSLARLGRLSLSAARCRDRRLYGLGFPFRGHRRDRLLLCRRPRGGEARLGAAPLSELERHRRAQSGHRHRSTRSQHDLLRCPRYEAPSVPLPSGYRPEPRHGPFGGRADAEERLVRRKSSCSSTSNWPRRRPRCRDNSRR